MGNVAVGSVSTGTLDTYDLVPAFLSALEMVNKDAYDEIVAEYHEEGALDVDGNPVTGKDETLSWLVADLIQKLNEEAPEGYFFGAHYGDGADFGFWQSDAEYGGAY